MNLLFDFFRSLSGVHSSANGFTVSVYGWLL